MRVKTVAALGALRQAALAVALIAAALGVVGPAAAQSLGGDYRVEGTNFDGSRYKGTARITITSNTTCRITWSTGTEASGICMRTDDVIAASYKMGGSLGLIIYRLQSDGSLDGVWTIADQSGAGTERLIPR
ncbi:hypothetical protein [Methyloraptor flagellatus]|uniref:Uncharacterized protein n=1 Tax=Methyloraptor flagellatus TaxID=3162530 RepID=A0AAU7X938_9HYPH